MSNDPLFSLNNLSNDPNFNFINTISGNSDVEEEDSHFDFSDSPYFDRNISCNYMDETQYVRLEKNNNKFSYMSLNIQSLPSKFNSFNEMISNFNKNNCAPDVIALQEIWQISDPAFFPLPNYSLLEYKCRRNNVQGGGVGLYFKKGIRFNILHNKCVFVDKVFESIFSEVWLPGSKKTIVGSIYRPNTAHHNLTTSEQFSQFFDLLTNILDELSSCNTPVLIFGDFNLDVLKYGILKNVTDYVDLLFSYGFLQLILKPTRCTPNSASVIDHILTNTQAENIKSVILVSPLSDHFPIIHFSNCVNVANKSKNITYRDFSTANVNRFSEAIRNIDWTQISSINDAQESYDEFAQIFFNFYELFFPCLTKKINKNTHGFEPWMTKGILVSRLNKISLHKEFVKNPVEANHSKFKNSRNLYNKIIKASKKIYFQSELTKHQSNLKKTWLLLRKAINNKAKKDNSIQNIIVNGSLIDDPFLMATHFNNFFANVATDIVSNIHPVNTPLLNTIHNFDNPLSFSSDPVTPSEIVEVMDQLKEKTTQDSNGLSTVFLKKVIRNISVPICHIINRSLITGIVPKQLKCAKIIPLFKTGDSTVPDNYRPISLLSSFSKLLEKTVYNRLSNHIEKYKFLSEFQFGFRKDHSTVHPMLHFLNHITSALEKKEHTVAIFCDLRKAFDCVNHDILFTKLEKMGILNTELNWFKNYLLNREQFVFINGTSSNCIFSNSGVPQGSILGPLLFLIYINDLPICSKFLSLLFADDTTLLLSHSDINILMQMANLEFQKIVTFFRSHKLSLHPLKTKFMIFSNSNNVKAMNLTLNINFNNLDEDDICKIFPVERITNESNTPAIRFLGVFFDPQLNFNYHIKCISAKLSKALYMLRSTKNFLTLKARKAVYYTLFHSHLIYCLPIWSCTTASSTNCLVTMQKKAVRIVNSSNYNAHTEPIFKNLRILPFSKLVSFFNLQIMQKFKQGFLPSSFNNIWSNNRMRRENLYEISLRNENLINIPFTRLSSSMKMPLINLPRIWEEFSIESIKILRNKEEFNCKLKKHFLDELSATVNCNRLFCPACQLHD